MARRTKEQAAITRCSILDAAERLFVKQGVARTTLQDIASAAGVTRGAVYWYFDDKAVLFNEMIQRATWPFEVELARLDRSDNTRPLVHLREFLLSSLRRTACDPHVQRVFEIVTSKVEMNDEMEPLAAFLKANIENWISVVGSRIAAARENGSVHARLNDHLVARAMWAMFDGLIRNWIFDRTRFDIVELGEAMLDVYLLGLQSYSAGKEGLAASPDVPGGVLQELPDRFDMAKKSPCDFS